MDFIVENWMLIAVAFVSGGMLVWPLVSRGVGGSGSVDANRAVQLINREKAVVIDVSEPQEFAGGHIIGSRNVPFGALEQGGAGLPNQKTTHLLVVCPTGARASRAAATLRAKGHEQVHVLAGGLNAWRSAGLPLEKGDGKEESASGSKGSAKSGARTGGKGSGKRGGGKAAATAVTAAAVGATAAAGDAVTQSTGSDAAEPGGGAPESAAFERDESSQESAQEATHAVADSHEADGSRQADAAQDVEASQEAQPAAGTAPDAEADAETDVDDHKAQAR